MIKYLLEIKNRLIIILLSLFFSLLICYIYKEILLFVFIEPGEAIKVDSDLPILYFIFTDLREIFFVYLKIVSFISIQIIIFYIVYNFFIFVSPALFKKEYFFYKKLLITCFLSWVFSLLLSNYFLIPLSWHFFFSFHTFISANFISLHFEPKVMEYLNFCLLIYYTCILYCQLFVVLLAIVHYFLDNVHLIKKYRKFYYFIFVIFSTITSPPDVFSQVIASVSLMIAYEFSILRLIFKKLLVR